MDINNAQSMPSKDAMRQQIKRVRRQNVMSEPTSLDSLFIPEELKHTLNGEPFLINESEIGNDKILLFTTLANLRKLELAKYWIMDGTFKTVPTIFHQLYSVHAPVGHDTNSRILPLVFALLSSKSKECYIRMFQDLQDYASENNIVLQPDYILTDFEQAAICAVKQEFTTSQSRLCLFHLGQSMWRKVQSVGLSIKYGEDEEFSLLVRHLLALAFLPPEEIPSAFAEIKEQLEIESGTEHLLMWFEDNYVLGRVRKTLRNGNIIRGLPLFSPELWSVFNQNIPRTQNNIEAWHRRWECLVGESHVGVYHLIKELQKEQKNTEIMIESILRGVPRPHSKKKTEQREDRIQNVIQNQGNVPVMEFLRGIAYNMTL